MKGFKMAIKKLKKEILEFNYKDLKGKVLIIKVGSDNRPATDEDIKEVAKSLEKYLSDIDCKIIVTHHAIEAKIS